MIAVGLVSLGCAKNQVDSEVMLGLLRRRGFEITHRPERADVLVVNTCGFLESAREEGYETIRDLAELRRSGRCRRLVVAGCMVQWRAEEMRSRLPEVDQFLGLNDLEKIADACQPDGTSFEPDLGPATWMPGDRHPRLVTDPGPSAYLKISEGCDNPCAFCVIPAIRGRFRSRPVPSLVEEARLLSRSGVRELNLIAQDSTSYGSDLGYSPGLPGLLSALGRVDGIEWIRVLYAYPNRLTPDLSRALADLPRVLPYLDLPLQHASRSVLARMRRGGSRESFTRIVEDLRNRVPGLSLRTTFIVGFPGETEAEFAELAGFLEEIRFDHVGLFTYSHEPSAPSYALANNVPEETKRERFQVLQDMQERISAEIYRRRIGETLSVLVEGEGPEPGTFSGRSFFQAPEVDGHVVFRHAAGRPEGIVRVAVEESVPYELRGRSLEPSAATGPARRRIFSGGTPATTA